LAYTFALFSIESEAFANKQCYTDINACNTACASTCNGKAFKCNLDVGKCNDELASLIETCSANSCPAICDSVMQLIGLPATMFGEFPASVIANIPGFSYFILRI
jgi:hypothetical protein